MMPWQRKSSLWVISMEGMPWEVASMADWLAVREPTSGSLLWYLMKCSPILKAFRPRVSWLERSGYRRAKSDR